MRGIGDGGDLLLTDDWLIGEFLAEDQALIAPFDALFRGETHHSSDAAGHHPALVVEVAENNVDAFVFFAEEVLDGYFDVVKCDICSTGRGGVGGLDRGRLDAIASFDENDG